MFSTCCYFCWFSDPPWHPAGAEWDENGANNRSFGLLFDTISTHAAKKNATHNTTNLFFRNLGPKTRFPFTLWPTTTWNPQPTTHPFWMDLWLFWDTLKKPMFANAFSLLYTRFWQDLPRSPKICQDLPRSNKINQRIGKHKPASATCRNKSWNAELQKWGGGGVTPHGVFNPLRARGRPRRVWHETCIPYLFYIYHISFLPRIYPIRRILWC